MKIETIREMTPAELSSELLKLKNELFNLRFQKLYSTKHTSLF